MKRERGSKNMHKNNRFLTSSMAQMFPKRNFSPQFWEWRKQRAAPQPTVELRKSPPICLSYLHTLAPPLSCSVTLSFFSPLSAAHYTTLGSLCSYSLSLDPLKQNRSTSSASFFVCIEVCIDAYQGCTILEKMTLQYFFYPAIYTAILNILDFYLSLHMNHFICKLHALSFAIFREIL